MTTQTPPLIDCYVLLGIERTSDDLLIRKAYRKRALELHPDKNPDNPKAEELFLAVKAASDTLLDKNLRAVLDAKLLARDAATARNNAMDSRRARLRSELEAREKAAADLAKRADKGAKDLSARIERLRQEGRARQEEFQSEIDRREQVRQQTGIDALEVDVLDMADNVGEEEISQRCVVKLNWSIDVNSRLGDETGKDMNTITTISEGRLRSIFKLYGEISSIVARRAADRSACIIFTSADSAEAAIAVPPDGFLISRMESTSNSVKDEKQDEIRGIKEESHSLSGKRRRNDVEGKDQIPTKMSTVKPNNLSFLEREAQVLSRLEKAAQEQIERKASQVTQ